MCNIELKKKRLLFLRKENIRIYIFEIRVKMVCYVIEKGFVKVVCYLCKEMGERSE